jgi:hypothetical protein
MWLERLLLPGVGVVVLEVGQWTESSDGMDLLVLQAHDLLQYLSPVCHLPVIDVVTLHCPLQGTVRTLDRSL